MLSMHTTHTWILGDNKIGGLNQAIALAERIGKGYEIKTIEYNILANLPNLLLPIKPIHIKKSTLTKLNATNAPKVIISSGRRTSELAIYLKRKFNTDTKIIQIMRPCCSLDEFNLVILPQHDKILQSFPNIIRIIGALNNIKAKMNNPIVLSEFAKHYPNIDKFIGVIIGGNTKKYKFTNKIAIKLANILENISINHGIPLFISFSRRTPLLVREIFKRRFNNQYNIIFDPTEDNIPNPYFGMLSCAEYIITTADSISICSEVASSGRPIYIFCPNEFKLKKHRFFIQQLIDLNIAKICDDTVHFLEKYSYTPLNEVKKVVQIIHERGID